MLQGRGGRLLTGISSMGEPTNGCRDPAVRLKGASGHSRTPSDNVNSGWVRASEQIAFAARRHVPSSITAAGGPAAGRAVFLAAATATPPSLRCVRCLTLGALPPCLSHRIRLGIIGRAGFRPVCLSFSPLVSLFAFHASSDPQPGHSHAFYFFRAISHSAVAFPADDLRPGFGLLAHCAQVDIPWACGQPEVAAFHFSPRTSTSSELLQRLWQTVFPGRSGDHVRGSSGFLCALPLTVPISLGPDGQPALRHPEAGA